MQRKTCHFFPELILQTKPICILKGGARKMTGCFCNNSDPEPCNDFLRAAFLHCSWKFWKNQSVSALFGRGVSAHLSPGPCWRTPSSGPVQPTLPLPGIHHQGRAPIFPASAFLPLIVVTNLTPNSSLLFLFC